MTFIGGGYSVELEHQGGWCFLHSLTGSGGPQGFLSFMWAVLHACSDAVLVCTVERPSAEKLYKRLGFLETGETWGGHKVLIKFPVQEANV